MISTSAFPHLGRVTLYFKMDNFSNLLLRGLWCLLLINGVLTYRQKVPPTEDNENNPYHHRVNLDGVEGRYVLEWTVDWTARRVLFQATVQTRGYIIFGLSRRGALPGADVVIGGVDSRTGTGYLQDMHGVLQGYPQIQTDRSQDYQLVSATENRTHTRLAFSREFDTCDGDQDYRINDDTVELLWGYGENDSNRNNAHRSIRGTYKAYLLGPDWAPRGIQEAKRTGQPLTSQELGDLDVWTVSRSLQIPAQDTTYWCSLHKGPVLQKRHHLVGFDFRWENEVQFNHTHHFLFLRCIAPPGVDPNDLFGPFVQNDTNESCALLSRDPSQVGGRLPTSYCGDVVYVYGIGGRQFFLPEEAGIPFGDSPDEYYLLQVHYDNPQSLSNLEYEVNIDMYYTPNLRPHDAGIMTVGHQLPGSPSIIVPPNSANHNIYGHCGSGCTERMFPPEGISILGTVLHTHNSGVGFRFQHFRGNRELPWISNDNNYDNRFQTIRMSRNELRILPGDQMSTRCIYDNTWANGNSVVGGLSTRQEMCLAYIYYINRVDFRLCRSEIGDVRYSQKHLGVTNWTWSEPDLEYVVTDDSTLQGLTTSQVGNLQDWTPSRRQELMRDQLLMPQQTYCPSNTASRTGEGGAIPIPLSRYPVGVAPYAPVEDGPNCRRRAGKQ